MAPLSNILNGLMKSPTKSLGDLLSHTEPLTEPLKHLLSFEYNDRPTDPKYYSWHSKWLKLLHDYYFKVQHTGAVEKVAKVAKQEKVILISNHANTLEAILLCYYFYRENYGMVRSLVYKEVFRLPMFRELFRSGQCLPVSVEAGKNALKKDHILLFPEGMDFIKHYMQKDYVVKFHKGFLRIAREHLYESGDEHVTLLPVGHDGIAHTIKFWILKHPFLVKHFIEPYLKYPFFIMPKAPVIFPTNAVFAWGEPRRIRLSDLKTEKALSQLSHQFRQNILRLKHRARKIREYNQITRLNTHIESS